MPRKITGFGLHFVLAVFTPLALVLAGCQGQPMPERNAGGISPVLSPVPSVTPTVLTNGWYRYHDPDLGFSFSYPPETRVKAGKSKFGTTSIRLQFKLPGAAGYQGMAIRVESNPEELPVEQVLAALYEQSTQELAPEEILSRTELITVAGQPALKTDILATNADFSILFLHKGRIFVLAPVHDPASTALDPQAMDLFYQVLNTLAFDS